MKNMLAKKSELLIVPLGGVDQIGANCTLIGNDHNWLMVDLGIAFYDKYGIDVLTPDVTFPISIKENLLGIFLTHAHEDHIGAISYLWPQLKCPIYLTEFPAVILRQKLEEFSWKDEVPIHIVKHNSRFEVKNFECEFIPLSHSIIDASSIYIKTKAGNIFHTGDWKIDDNPLVGKKTDGAKLLAIGKEGVDCLLCDSTNIMNDFDSGSELDVRNTLTNLVDRYKEKRITVTCFASNLARIETILKVAKGAGRKVAVIGRSMHKMINAIAETTYFSKDFKDALSCVITPEEAIDMQYCDVIFLCTGSQGEFRSALYKIARGENRGIRLGDKDVVFFSSKVIPGNEIEIRNMQNILVRRGVEIVTSEIEENIHVSGHPGKSSVLKMYKWLMPHSLIPVHGDASMIFAQKRFAEENGIQEIYTPEMGDVIRFNGGKLSKIDHIDVEYFAIDGPNIIPLSSIPIKERGVMAYHGYVSISFLVDNKGQLRSGLDIIISGIPMDQEVSNRVKKLSEQVIRNALDTQSDNLDNAIKEIKRSVRRTIERMTQKKPIISIHIHEVN